MIGRFLSIDLLSGSFAHQSHYCYAANNPIRYNEKQGLYPQEPEYLKIQYNVDPKLKYKLEVETSYKNHIIEAAFEKYGIEMKNHTYRAAYKAFNVNATIEAINTSSGFYKDTKSEKYLLKELAVVLNIPEELSGNLQLEEIAELIIKNEIESDVEDLLKVLLVELKGLKNSEASIIAGRSVGFVTNLFTFTEFGPEFPTNDEVIRSEEIEAYIALIEFLQFVNAVTKYNEKLQEEYESK